MSQSSLEDRQISRTERNRTKALNLRRAKLVNNECVSCPESSIIKLQGTKYIDSGGGYLIEENQEDKAKTVQKACGDNVQSDSINIPVEHHYCLECSDRFADSYLWKNFSHCVCDKCRDPDEKHSLITRTDAKAEYLLKDCDFDKRQPALKYISRINPHNPRWGDMKLYLQLQVEKRALEVWGSENELKNQHLERETKRRNAKDKKYCKQLKQLRMEVRSSLYTKETKLSHVHEFGKETYNEEYDNYSRKCLLCMYSETFEKM